MNITEKIKKFILDEVVMDDGFKMENFEDDEDIISSGLLDSLGLLKLASFIEEEYNIKIHDSDISFDNFRRISLIEKFILSKSGN